MLVERVGPDGPVLICVNPRCPRKNVPETADGQQQDVNEEEP